MVTARGQSEYSLACLSGVLFHPFERGLVMSKTIEEAVVMAFGEVVIGDWFINEKRDLQTNITLATGEVGKLIAIPTDEGWSHKTDISGVKDSGSFNGGSSDSFEEVYHESPMIGDLLHNLVIPVPAGCVASI